MMKNRFVLAPLTNCQSYEDGRLSEEEFRWLVMRARGGFAVTMTGAASVQASGKGFAGQLGIYSDEHIEGLSRLAIAIRAESSIAMVQLHHSGIRSVSAFTGADPVGPSAHAKSGARALTESEIEQVIADFITAADRAERAGIDGVEIHGGPGYLLGSFLSPMMNQRSDVYGGSLDNRARILRAIIAGIRESCRPGFVLGLRLLPEGHGVKFGEMRLLAGELLAEGALDFLDMCLWQIMKEPEDETFKDRRLIDWFADLPRGRTRLGVGGHIRTRPEAQQAIDRGADFVFVGHAAIIHHDFPARLRHDDGFVPVSLPVTRHYLNREGVSDKFVAYIKGLRPNFVAEESAHSGRDEQHPNRDAAL
jgi:2,4-dienoyl-CoA reductase-like NADH-dependent reductase (Old Yellow Enzyme family)